MKVQTAKVVMPNVVIYLKFSQLIFWYRYFLINPTKTRPNHRILRMMTTLKTTTFGRRLYNNCIIWWMKTVTISSKYISKFILHLFHSLINIHHSVRIRLLFSVSIRKTRLWIWMYYMMRFVYRVKNFNFTWNSFILDGKI